MNDRIVVDPEVCFGKPVIRGTRTPVSLVLGSLAGGTPVGDIQREYGLSAEDVRAAVMFSCENQLSDTWRPGAYTITFAPGVVKYLDVSDFLRADVTVWIEIFRGMSLQPLVKSPSGSGNLNLSAVDELIPSEPWDNRLRFHHAFGRLCLEFRVPSKVYCCFHRHLELKAVKADECVKAWVRSAWGNDDVTESFIASLDHLVVEGLVFQKTPFVLERLQALEREAELESKRLADEADARARRQLQDDAAKKEAEDLDRLRKSSFRTFIYLMEDLRNHHFKIGRSKTPRRRERTLQAEVPQIVLRLSIPADEAHETELHEHFADKRLRGEWFSLTAENLLWLVSFLKRNGDVERAWVDSQWLGTVCFHASETQGAQ